DPGGRASDRRLARHVHRPVARLRRGGRGRLVEAEEGHLHPGEGGRGQEPGMVAVRHHGRRLPPLAPLLIVAAALAAAVAFPCGAAGAAPARPQVVIVIADKLAVEDFQEFPAALEPLAERLSTGGAAGMMNVRTAAGATSANGYASLAAGARAAVGPWAGLALAPGETHQGLPAASLYQSLTGLSAQGRPPQLGL